MMAKVSAITRSSSTTRTLGLVCGEVIFVARCWMQNLPEQQLGNSQPGKDYIEGSIPDRCSSDCLRDHRLATTPLAAKSPAISFCPGGLKEKITGILESVTCGEKSGPMGN